MNIETTFAKCHCHLCGGGIEFPSEGADQWITCPHCGRETVLVIPTSEPLPSSAATEQCSSVRGFWRRLVGVVKKQYEDPPPIPLPPIQPPVYPPIVSKLRACPDCGREISIRSTACPHCGAPGLSATEASPIRYAGIQSKSEGCGAGCFLQLVGLVLLFLFPIGTILGIAMIIWGHFAAQKFSCGNCGNVLSSNSVKLCPACQAHFQ